MPHWRSLSVSESICYRALHSRPETEAAAALKTYNDAESELTKLRSDKEEAEANLQDLFDPAHFGAQGEWKKLEDTCLEQESGE